MAKNRILFILHIPPPVHGSSMVGQYINESKIINQAFNCRYINLGTSRTVDEIGKNTFYKINRYLFILWQVLVQLIRFRPQLCYLSITSKGSAFYKDSVLACMVKLFGVKLVYHFHNKGVETHQDKPIDNFLYKRVFKNAEFILLSKYLYPDIQKYVVENQVHYCPNGIPATYTKHKTENQSEGKAAEILFLSNLIESKGVFILLDACVVLKQKQIPFHCTVVGGEGDITSDQFNRKVNELELETHVNFAGKKYGNEKESVFACADIFVHPTFEDCFPLVLLEAMQNNLPIISTFEGGIPDIVENGKTGFLVPPKNIQPLIDKLEMLITNRELRKKMGEAGRLKYEKEFTVTIFENRLVEILNTILNRQK